MTAQVLLGALCVLAAVPLLWWGGMGGRSGSHTAAVAGLRLGAPPVTDLREIQLSGSATDRAVRPAVQALARRARRITPAAFVDRLERRIVLAGQPPGWPLERVLAAKLLLGVAGLLLGLLVLSGGMTGIRAVFAAGVTALAYFAPDLLLYSRGSERQSVIQRELPDTMDQIMISVEAGLGFEAALARAGSTGNGPLAEELTRTLQDVRIGVARREALTDLAERTDVPEVRHFVMAVRQAESYGLPIAGVLRVQAAELRQKRSQRAEEHAMKVPVKVLFPLMFCILPALFVVVIGPAVVSISQTGFGG